MSAKQKLSDLIELLKKERKAQVIAGGLALGVLFMMVYEPKPKRRVQPAYQVREQSPDTIGAATANQVYNDLQEVVVKRLDEQRDIMNQFQSSLTDTNKRIEENEIRTAEIFETLIKRVESQQPALPSSAAGVPAGEPIGDTPAFPPQDEFYGDSLESFGEVADEGVVAPPPIAPVDTRSAYIAPTDFVRVKLLAGVNAPTDGSPYPVLLELIGDVQSPDGGSLPLGGARILAAAQGSLVDSRALFRLTTLTTRLPNGESVDISIDGYMVGEDGILGLPGVPIDPLGKILGATAVTGFIQGAGNALSQSQTTNFVTPDGGLQSAVTGDALQFAAGQGLAQPANIWTSIIRERVQSQVPVIQVYSGREATAVFTRGTVIPRLYEQLQEGETDIFADID